MVKCNIFGNPNTLWPGFHHEARDRTELMIYNRSAFNNKSFIQLNKEAIFNTGQTLHAKTSIDSIQCNGAQNLHVHDKNLAINMSTKKYLKNNICIKKEDESLVTPCSETFCSTCFVDCRSVELLQEHKEIKPFICRVCTDSFETHDLLETHFLTHKVFKCNYCSQAFHFKKDLFQHQKYSTKCNNKVECVICHKMISSKRRNRHLKQHKNIAKNYRCVVCDKACSLQHELFYHYNQVHTAFESVECNICKKIFFSPDKLKTHVQSIHLNHGNEPNVVQCNICNKILNKQSFKNHMMTKHDNEVQQCEQCGKSIKGYAAMKSHIQKEHSKIGTFICKVCNQQFDRQILLIQHRKKVHSKTKVHKPAFCEICGKKYTNSTALKNHQFIHSDERPFKCKVCGASFKQKSILNLHGRVHSSFGKYICDYCGYSFKWKKTFVKHVINCGSTNAENNIRDG